MGQYYHTVIVPEENEEHKIYEVCNNCDFRYGWVGLKLMEHSYLNNEWTDAIARFIYRKKCRIAHVGDYADEYPQYELAYCEAVNRTPVDVSDMYDKDGKLIEFDYHGKYLVNYDKRVYIYFDKYKEKSKVEWDDDTYVCPFTLLTALGNGRGGGDYWEEYPNADLIGSWVWDLISIEDSVPADFTEYPVYFVEK